MSSNFEQFVNNLFRLGAIHWSLSSILGLPIPGIVQLASTNHLFPFHSGLQDCHFQSVHHFVQLDETRQRKKIEMIANL